MIAPGVSLGCLTPVTCLGPVSGLGGGVAGAAAGALFAAVNSAMSDAADWLVGHVVDLIQTTTSPDLNAGWFRSTAGLMETVAVVGLLPVLMAASIGPVLRQDGRRLFRVWGIGLPVAVLAGMAGSQLAALALRVTDALCQLFLGSHSHQLATHFSDAMANGLVASSPVLVQMLLAALTVVGTILVWLEMMVRDGAVYVAVFFMPLALVAYIWPATTGMARRGVEILTSLILSKFVIVAVLTLGLAALGGQGPDAAVAGAGLMLLAGFAPFTLMRLAPIVEAAAISHLEGVSRRPARAAMRAASVASAASGHPLVQLLGSRAAGQGGSDGAGTAPVAAQILRERAPDFPLPEHGDAGAPGGPGNG